VKRNDWNLEGKKGDSCPFVHSTDSIGGKRKEEDDAHRRGKSHDGEKGKSGKGGAGSSITFMPEKKKKEESASGSGKGGNPPKREGGREAGRLWTAFQVATRKGEKGAGDEGGRRSLVDRGQKERDDKEGRRGLPCPR